MNCKRRIMLMVSVVFGGIIWAGSAFAEEVIVQGVLKSTGGFKFPDGTILSSVGNISGNGSSGAFQATQTGSGFAIEAHSQAGDAVHASGTQTGIYGESLLANGILGFTYANGNSYSGVVGSSQGSANGVWGQSASGFGVRGSSTSGDAIHGESTSSTGLYGQSSQANGILGYTGATSNSYSGVVGSSHGIANGVWGNNTSNGIGVRGSSSTGDAVHGESAGTAVYGQSSGSVGVLGYTTATGAQNSGVKGLSQSDAQGVIGEGRSTGAGVYAENSGSGYALWAKSSGTGAAGHFEGNLEVFGAAYVNSSASNGLYVSTSANDGNGISSSANNGSLAYGVLGSSSSGYGVVGYASGSALAAGRFFSTSGTGTAIIAESPLNTQVMKVDAAGVHAGPGMTGTPLAYGVVDDVGTCTYKSANVSCTKDSTGYYNIAIAGENYDPAKYITIVTLAYNTSQLISFVDYQISTSHMIVRVMTSSGTMADNRFYFVTFKP